MPYYLPRRDPDQAAYNRHVQQQFDSTRRVSRPAPAVTIPDVTAQLRELGELRASGVLTDAEFEVAKRRVLGP